MLELPSYATNGCQFGEDNVKRINDHWISQLHAERHSSRLLTSGFREVRSLPPLPLLPWHLYLYLEPSSKDSEILILIFTLHSTNTNAFQTWTWHKFEPLNPSNRRTHQSTSDCKGNHARRLFLSSFSSNQSVWDHSDYFKFAETRIRPFWPFIALSVSSDII